MAYQFIAHIIIKGTIECVTGLHIGGTEEGYEIGGLDNPILKDKITQFPYIPGSSIKGKMRSMTEWRLGKIEAKGNIHGQFCKNPKCEVCRIFGRSADRPGKEEDSPGPTRLIVRDAHLSEKTKKNEQYVKNDVFMTEIKTENSLNRITSEANPRQMERVPRGTMFDFEMVYGIYDMDDNGETDIQYLEHVAMALEMMEASVLGGDGSRGSGQIRLEKLTTEIKRLKDYQEKTSQKEEKKPDETIGNFMKRIQEILKSSGNGRG